MESRTHFGSGELLCEVQHLKAKMTCSGCCEPRNKASVGEVAME